MSFRQGKSQRVPARTTCRIAAICHYGWRLKVMPGRTSPVKLRLHAHGEAPLYAVPDRRQGPGDSLSIRAY